MKKLLILLSIITTFTVCSDTIEDLYKTIDNKIQSKCENNDCVKSEKVKYKSIIKKLYISEMHENFIECYNKTSSGKELIPLEEFRKCVYLTKVDFCKAKKLNNPSTMKSCILN